MTENNYNYEKEKPFYGVKDLKRQDAAKYLNRMGRGLNCRMDIPVLSIEDIRWAACVFRDLGKELESIVEAKKSDIIRVVSARNAMEGARFKLKLNTHSELTKGIKEKADKSKNW
jgi:hypothetical protein